MVCSQVEHGITEMVTGLDLVNWQLQLQVPGLAPPDLSKSLYEPSGWAMEARINAEEPFKDFAPSSGVLGQVAWPPGKHEVSHPPSKWLESVRHAKVALLACAVTGRSLMQPC